METWTRIAQSLTVQLLSKTSVSISKRQWAQPPSHQAVEMLCSPRESFYRCNECTAYVLYRQHGLHIIDLDAPFSPPRHLRHETPWTPADVQWSPFAQRYYWVVSTSNQRALVWNLETAGPQAPIEHVLHAHSRAITDINFSAHHPDILATCAIDSFVHCWDLRTPSRPAVSFSDWYAGASQVKWNRQDSHVVASSHDRRLQIWDDRKGAIPLTTIDAHATKIYGIDWNRTNATKIITCSLDRTIKTWDYSVSDILPERVIETSFPVWRARNTPFGEGVLAMPQRGNFNLHLYDQRMDEDTPWSAETDPVHSFKGHKDQVKEFLWRARGSINEGTDNRDFQLVTWGADNELILHRMRDKHLKRVGFEKGMSLDEHWTLTRRGSPYKTFRDPPLVAPGPFSRIAPNDVLQSESPNGIFNQSTSPGMSRAPIPTARSGLEGPSMMTYSGIQARNAAKPDNSLISWMKGVKFGKRGASFGKRKSKTSLPEDHRMSFDHAMHETLSEEIVHVGETFKKVNFEEADVPARRIKVSMNGPWSIDKKPVYLQLRVSFPTDYPEAAKPQFHLEQVSSISEEMLSQLQDDLERIAAAFATHKIGCLEAVLSYLLGEHDLEQSIGWLAINAEDAIEEVGKGESSSDEDDGLGDFGAADSQTLDAEGPTGSGILGSNANVPLPKGCGAIWAPDGRLVCFFPPKAGPVSLLEKVGVRGDRHPRDGGLFEGFGRLHADSPEPRHRISNRGPDISEDSEGYDSSDSSSSSDSEDGDLFPGRFYPPKAWRGASLRFKKLRTHSAEGSQRTSVGQGKTPSTAKHNTVVSLKLMDEFLPSKKSLAKEYCVYGRGPVVCAHNASVAKKFGCDELTVIWELAGQILCDNVPLAALLAHQQPDGFLVLAKRALVSIRRSDSGVDLSFDEPESVSNPLCKGLVKWGNHPVGNTWLVRSLFEHFEKRADVQMLAMLSCVFAEDFAIEKPAPGSVLDSMKWPGQPIDYLPSEEVALCMRRPMISLSMSPERSHSTSAFGSQGSSESFRDAIPAGSEPPTPLSFGSTPPILSRASTQRSSAAQSMSTSPEHRMFVPSAASSFAASVFARPFQLSSSPPRARLSGDENLSTSNASSSGVTWGPTTFHGSNATIRRSYLAQELAGNYDDGESTEEDEPFVADVSVKVGLKNQAMFDDEGHADVPFLDPQGAGKYAAYREDYAHLLDVWGLSIQRSEILKFNVGTYSSGLQDISDNVSQTTLTIGKTEQAEKATMTDSGLVVARCCTSCGRAESNARLGARCSSCDAAMRLMRCSICEHPITTLYKACLDCGHAAHMSCLRTLLEDLDGDELDCETGCGCRCLIDHPGGLGNRGPGTNSPSTSSVAVQSLAVV